MKKEMLNQIKDEFRKEIKKQSYTIKQHEIGEISKLDMMLRLAALQRKKQSLLSTYKYIKAMDF